MAVLQVQSEAGPGLGGSKATRPFGVNQICRIAQAGKKGPRRWYFSFQPSSKAAWEGGSWPFPSCPAFMHVPIFH